MTAPTITHPGGDQHVTTDKIKAVRAARRKLERAQAARDAAMRAMVEAIRDADGTEGVTRNLLVQESGLARQTVYDALKGEQR